jgi:N-glycosylase/DNA lyase
MLEINNSTFDDFKNLWFDYLDLGRDYSEIKRRLLKDEHMERAVAFGQGIRLLKQDFWETLISFIISANNRIPRIMQIVDTISHMYGNEIVCGGKSYYSFPGPEKLISSESERLKICKAGFRCKYILGTTKQFLEGEVDCTRLKEIPRDDARELLVKFSGVGNKVADCTLLYSGTKYNVFPTDVWVLRVMEELYFKRKTSFKEIQAFADDYFGELAGFAQQYLFYYARENRIGV